MCVCVCVCVAVWWFVAVSVSGQALVFILAEAGILLLPCAGFSIFSLFYNYDYNNINNNSNNSLIPAAHKAKMSLQRFAPIAWSFITRVLSTQTENDTLEKVYVWYGVI